MPADDMHLRLLQARQLQRAAQGGGKDHVRPIGHMAGKLRAGRAGIQKNGGVFLHKADGLFGDDLLFIRVAGGALKVQIVRADEHLHRARAAMGADDALAAIQVFQIAPQRHLGHLMEIFL